MRRRTREELRMLRAFGFRETADAFEFSHSMLEKLRSHFIQCGKPKEVFSVLAAGSLGKLVAVRSSDVECYGLADDRESLGAANESMLKYHRYLAAQRVLVEKAKINGKDPLDRPLEGFQWKVWHVKRFMRTNTTKPHLESMFKENLTNVLFMSRPIFNKALAKKYVLMILEYHRKRRGGDALRSLYHSLMQHPFAQKPNELQKVKLTRDMMINTITGIHLALFDCACIGRFESSATLARQITKRLPDLFREPFRKACTNGLDSHFRLRDDIEKGRGVSSLEFQQHMSEFIGAWRTVHDVNHELAIERRWDDLLT